MSELCKLWLVNQTLVSPRCEGEVGMAVKGHQEGALRGGNAVSLDWVSVSILGHPFPLFPDSISGENRQGVCAISLCYFLQLHGYL